MVSQLPPHRTHTSQTRKAMRRASAVRQFNDELGNCVRFSRTNVGQEHIR